MSATSTPSTMLHERPAIICPPGHVTQQAANVSTFTPPPFDGSLPFGDFIDWHLTYSEYHNYCILVEEGEQENVPVTYGEFCRAIHRVARQIQDAVPDGPARENGMPKTVALLSGADALTYLTLLLGIMRAGFEAFPLSNRNSDHGIRHLLTGADAHYLVGSVGTNDKPRTALQQSIQNVLTGLKSDSYDFTLISEPHFSQVYPRLAQRPIPAYHRDEDIDGTPILPPLSTMPSYKDANPHTHPCFILHSSGSTKFPKIIRQNQRAMRHWVDWPWYGDVDLGGTVGSVVGLPGFHAGGVTFGIGHPLGCGVTLVNFMPVEPATQVSPDTALLSFRKSNCDWCFGIPAFLDTYSNDPEIIKFLATKTAVVFGSSPLPEEAGDRLVAGGVNLVNIYGATETGIVSRLCFERRTDWLYTEISPMVNHRLQEDDDAGDIYRLVFEPNHYYSPAVYNIPGELAYDTNDVAVPHATRKNRYRILGRADDQIMHSTGEKTNPGPLENILCGSPLIKAAIYFGRARTQAGVVVEPFTAVDITSDAAIAEFRNKIWPYIERANKFGPSHSRVFKEYVLIADPIRKPFARTPKGSIARNGVLTQYEEEIEQIYAIVHEYNQYEWAQPPTSWDDESTYDFIARVINGVMEEPTNGKVDPLRDLLQATLIRNSIINALRHCPFLTGQSEDQKEMDPARYIPQNIVFAHPTITSLNDFVARLIHGSRKDGQPNHDTAKMLELVAKYGTEWPSSNKAKGVGDRVLDRNDINSQPQAECVLLTGSTGTLGAYLLSALLLDDKVDKVYAFNRPSTSQTIMERQLDALVDRGIPDKMIHHPKLFLLEGDTTARDLGLDMSVYNELLSSVTCIIHNAWRLDFNMSVSSFESHIRGARNLMDLALKSERPSKPQFLFTSSIGTVANWTRADPVPEEPLDAEVALGTGYGESKWVVDKASCNIMTAASEQCGLRTTTFRIGQLAGSMVNGAWNTTDWVPHIVKAGCILGSLPSMNEEDMISWLPVDAAAISIVQAMHQSTEGNRTLHVCHPYPATWNMTMYAIADYLEQKGQYLDLEPYPGWFQELEASGSKPDAVQKNPALRLLDFLRSGTRSHAHEREAMGFPLIDTTKMKATSSTFNNIPRLDRFDVKRWMEYWESHGLFA
ncbi:acetyl-CoA synthetase-like protein [Calocera viscosa TUFC12733]|uniref:Acetyl-CoA synthetase-like protein n=1 Tax=Calocera viscosa (strain TUFC12733) TaxID=1330018 RepID=A0A167JHI8_CALVF|nr:acetyl-CoA synthetase-like protein [Calocera viscosa TUFC12733]